MPKKTYMDNKNILSEGFFSKLFNLLKIKDDDVIDKVKKDKKVKKSLNNLNKNREDLENMLNSYLKDAGLKPDVKLNRYSLKDFI